MDVLVVLKSYAVSHQDESVWQPAVAEVDLRSNLEPIFRPTCHLGRFLTKE